MNIIVCVKLVPDAGDIETWDDGTVSVERAEWIIGGFDLQALESAVRLVEMHGGQVIALSAGPGEVNQSKLKKDLLSRGPDELVMVVDEALDDADTALTAAVLVQAIQKIGSFDLVLCGEGSADLYFQQVGLQVGEKLGLPTLNAVNQIEVQAGILLVERSLEEEIEVIEVPIPAVLSVTTDISAPRLPTMKEILKAGKKPIREWSLADLGLAETAQRQVEEVSTLLPQQVKRKQVIIEGAPDEAARALLEALSREGVL